MARKAHQKWEITPAHMINMYGVLHMNMNCRNPRTSLLTVLRNYVYTSDERQTMHTGTLVLFLHRKLVLLQNVNAVYNGCPFTVMAKILLPAIQKSMELLNPVIIY